MLTALCFGVQLFTETVGRGLRGLRCGRGWEAGAVRGGAKALEASAHEQLVFQILMVLNTKRASANPHGGGVRRKMTKICSLTGSHLYFSFVPLS